MRFKLTILTLLLAVKGFALNSAHFTITRVSAPYFIVDSNTPSTLTKAYVAFEIKNIVGSGVTYSGLVFTISSIGTSVVGQTYSVVSPASGQQLIGTLAPGESKVVYFFVSYPANTSPTGTFNVRLSDNTASDKTAAIAIYNRSSISANAGGLATQAFTNQDLIGGLVYDDISYSVGNVQNNDEVDFQVSVSPLFDPTKITLIGTEVITSTVPGVSVGSTDSLYYRTSAGGNGTSVTIRWKFRITATNFTTYFLPVAGATSGGSNYKYAINTALGANGTAVTISNTNSLTIAKTSNKSTYYGCESATFTLTVTNSGAYGVSIDSVSDALPTGFSFGAIDATSGVAAAALTSYPAAAATGAILFRGGVTSGANTSIFVPANSSVTIKYTATAPCNPASNLSTTVRGYIGTTNFATANNTVNVTWGLPVTWNDVSVRKQINSNTILWSTLTEQQTKNFIVQHSTDGRIFETIGTVTAAGNSNTLRSYSFDHLYPKTGKHYYRIEQVDLDNKSTFSKVVSIQNTIAGSKGIVVNSMVQNGQLQLLLPANGEVQIYTTEGRRMYSGKVIAGENKINVSSLPRGSYIVMAAGISDKFAVL